MDPIPEVLSPQQIKWRALADFVSHWFHQPDLEALEIILTVAASHYWVKSDPIWMFLVSLASSGKTSIFINACSGLKDSVIVGDIGKDTFLSAYGKHRDRGLLSVYPNPILLFKDFTTSLTKHPNEKAEIQSQMREIYDGEFVKDRGVGRVHWRGKVTCIAACTLALDRQWGIHRDLGERFITLRIHPTDAVKSSLKAASQRGHEQEIASEMRRLASDWVDMPTLKPPEPVNEETLTQVACLAQSVAWVRSHVIRDSQGTRRIIESPITEFSTRVFKQLALLGQFSSAVRREPVFRMEWLKRVALDSMPPGRFKIMGCIPVGSSTSSPEIALRSGLPAYTVKWHLEEMESLGILTQSGQVPVYSFTNEFTELCQKSGFNSFQLLP
jgi:hypothetical protein